MNGAGNSAGSGQTDSAHFFFVEIRCQIMDNDEEPDEEEDEPETRDEEEGL